MVNPYPRGTVLHRKPRKRSEMVAPYGKPTLREKYNFLLSKIKITDVDAWEQDALLKMDTLFFQFDVDDLPLDKDNAVIAALRNDRSKTCK